jgi:hypothetical protein
MTNFDCVLRCMLRLNFSDHGPETETSGVAQNDGRFLAPML